MKFTCIYVYKVFLWLFHASQEEKVQEEEKEQGIKEEETQRHVMWIHVASEPRHDHLGPRHHHSEPRHHHSGPKAT